MDLSGVIVECVLDDAAQTGESPFWCAAEQALYWIDIQQPALHRTDPHTGTDRHWIMPDEIGCFALRRDGSGAIVALRSGIHDFRFADESLRLLAPPPFDPALFRFNEGACDSAGRFWLGTMFDPRDSRRKPENLRGQWHSFTEAAGLRAEPDLAVIPNGLTWTADFRTMFTAHYQRGEILAFDFDSPTGRMSNRRLFASVPAEAGKPDGAVIDVEGCRWQALHGGRSLRRLHPDGSFDADLMLPISLPTMAAFGDSDLGTLYITTGLRDLPPERRAAEPLAGKLLRCRPGVSGHLLPMFGPG